MRCGFYFGQDQIVRAGLTFEQILKISQSDRRNKRVNAQRSPARTQRRLREMSERSSPCLSLVTRGYRVLKINDGNIRSRECGLFEAIGSRGRREQPAPDLHYLVLSHF